MDYTKVPRSLIYKDREDLNDFGVQTQGTLNNYLFTQMRRMTLLRCGDAKEIALQCFNNAFYICTLIELEEFPDLCMDKYEAILLPEMIPFPEDVYQASMALVCVFLAAYDDKYKQKDDPLIESIYHWTSSNKWVGSYSRKSFEDIIEKCSPDGFSVSADMFTPRNIIEAIKNADIKSLALGADYVCEKLDLLKDQRSINHEINLAIMRLNKRLYELYDEYGYDDKTDRFTEKMPFEEFDNLVKDVKHIKEAINTINKHYQIVPQTVDKLIYSIPTSLTNKHPAILTERNLVDAKGDTDAMQARINELTTENLKLKDQLNQVKNTLEQLKVKMTDYEARFDPKDIKGKKVSSMTGKQHAILFLAVLAHHSRIPNARTNLSSLLSFIASRNESTMNDYLKKRITGEECDELARYFDSVTPFIATLIRELPEKLEKDKSEKNRLKVLKKDKE